MRSCLNSEPLILIMFPIRAAQAKQIYVASFTIYGTSLSSKSTLTVNMTLAFNFTLSIPANPPASL